MFSKTRPVTFIITGLISNRGFLLLNSHQAVSPKKVPTYFIFEHFFKLASIFTSVISNIVRQSSGSRQAVARQSSGSRQTVIVLRQSSYRVSHSET